MRYADVRPGDMDVHNDGVYAALVISCVTGADDEVIVKYVYAWSVNGFLGRIYELRGQPDEPFTTCSETKWRTTT